MRRNYKYRIYLNQAQRKALRDMMYFLRTLYNCALEQRIAYYKRYGKSLSYNKQAAYLKGMKQYLSALYPGLENYYAQIFQFVLKTLDLAYNTFFSGGGRPRFKSEKQFKSIMFPQVASDLRDCRGVRLLDNNKLYIAGIPGEVKVKWHRKFEGVCKTASIKVEPSGKIHLILSCDNVPEEHLAFTEKVIAIDLGIENFITTDSGDVVKNPRFVKTSKQKMRVKQQKLSRKVKGSKNRERHRIAVAKFHEKVKNQRNDFQNKLVHKLISENDVVIMEDLNVKDMLKSKGYGVSKFNIADASLGEFGLKISCKAERAGKKVIKVNPMNTSKTCSDCKVIRQSMRLSDRIYKCNSCGYCADRDRNAALNIYRLGISLATTFL